MDRNALSIAIHELLRSEWVAKDPTPACFDHDEGRMAALLAAVDSGDFGPVRDHLIVCVRCRFVFVTTRAE